jgi:peptidoglycan/LPS O-acetylase OafA/YrhL
MAIGGLAAYSWRRSARLRSFVVALPRPFVEAVYCVGGMMLGLSYLGIGSFFNPLERVVVALLFAFIVLEQNFSRASFFKMAQFKWMSNLGRYTYGLYLLHAIVVTLLGRALFVAQVDGSGGWGRLVLGPVGLGLSVSLAALSYHGFEKPFLDLKSRFTHVRSGGP